MTGKRHSVRRFLLAVVLFVAAARASDAEPALVPQPLQQTALACRAPLTLSRPLTFPAGVDPGGFAIVRERWTALGIPAPVIAKQAAPAVMTDGSRTRRDDVRSSGHRGRRPHPVDAG